MPALAGEAGHDIVTASGDTLLGADDKAGVAEIMAAVAHLAGQPRPAAPDAADRLHAGRGDRARAPHLFDVERFGAALRLHDRRLDAR